MFNAAFNQPQILDLQNNLGLIVMRESAVIARPWTVDKTAARSFRNAANCGDQPEPRGQSARCKT